MVKIPIGRTTMMTTNIIGEKFLTRGNIFVIALSFILILLAPVSHAYHKGRYSPSHSMKGPIVINNPDQLLAGSSIQFIYIDAENCPDCEYFYNEELAKLRKSKLASKIYVTIIRMEDYSDPWASYAWPKYLRWIPDKADLKGCGPQFIALMGRIILGTYCHSNNLPTPQFTIVDSRGPEHEKTFIIKVAISSDKSWRGIGSTKKSAEQDGAQRAIDFLLGS